MFLSSVKKVGVNVHVRFNPINIVNGARDLSQLYPSRMEEG